MIRILLKSHSINYRDREGPLAAENTNWLPGCPPSSPWGRCVTLGAPCPLWVSWHGVGLCRPVPGHPKACFLPWAGAPGGPETGETRGSPGSRKPCTEKPCHPWAVEAERRVGAGRPMLAQP